MSALTEHYDELEQKQQVTDQADKYGSLVVPTGNSSTPVHRWFHLKEAFSHQMLETVLVDTALRDRQHLSVLDPFSGSGTTAVSACLLPEAVLSVEAYEVNPFLHELSSTKVSALQNPPKQLSRLAGEIVWRASGRRAGEIDPPDLSTFRNPKYFDPGNLRELLQLKAALDSTDIQGLDPLSTACLRIALASVIEPSSNLRRDGRTLRYVPRAAGDMNRAPADLFAHRVAEMDSDLNRPPVEVLGSVQHCDVRTALPDTPGNVDLSLFSPPYPNNIDYTEVYKLEAWLLGHITNSREFSDQRRASLRSHGSLLWRSDNVLPDYLQSAIEPILQAVPEDRYRASRQEVISGYAHDMDTVVRLTANRLRNGGHLAVVVGNSHHGSKEEGYIIAADLLIAESMRQHGLAVTDIKIARYPRRRSVESPYLRETVVFGRKD